MTTALSRLLESPEGRTALCVEQTIVNVTELLCKHLEESEMSRTALAKAMGVSPGRVTQLLDGNANLTLTSIARALAAFNHVLEVSSSPVDRIVEEWTPQWNWTTFRLHTTTPLACSPPIEREQVAAQDTKYALAA